MPELAAQALVGQHSDLSIYIYIWICWFPLYKLLFEPVWGVYPSFRHPYSIFRTRQKFNWFVSSLAPSCWESKFSSWGFAVYHMFDPYPQIPTANSSATGFPTRDFWRALASRSESHRVLPRFGGENDSFSTWFDYHKLGAILGLVRKICRINMDKPHIPQFWVKSRSCSWTLLDTVANLYPMKIYENIWKWTIPDWYPSNAGADSAPQRALWNLHWVLGSAPISDLLTFSVVSSVSSLWEFATQIPDLTAQRVDSFVSDSLGAFWYIVDHVASVVFLQFNRWIWPCFLNASPLQCTQHFPVSSSTSRKANMFKL